MKYLVRFFVILNLFFFATNLLAQETILYIDMNKVLNESKAGKLAQEYLKNKHKSNIEKNKKIEEKLKKSETDLINKKKLLDKDEYKKLSDELREKVKNYQLKRSSEIEELTTVRADSRKKLIQELQPILADYAKEKNINIIIDKKNIILGKTENDITNVIIEKLNKIPRNEESPSKNLPEPLEMAKIGRIIASEGL